MSVIEDMPQDLAQCIAFCKLKGSFDVKAKHIYTKYITVGEKLKLKKFVKYYDIFEVTENGILLASKSSPRWSQVTFFKKYAELKDYFFYIPESRKTTSPE